MKHGGHFSISRGSKATLLQRPKQCQGLEALRPSWTLRPSGIVWLAHNLHPLPLQNRVPMPKVPVALDYVHSQAVLCLGEG